MNFFLLLKQIIYNAHSYLVIISLSGMASQVVWTQNLRTRLGHPSILFYIVPPKISLVLCIFFLPSSQFSKYKYIIAR